MVEPPVRFAGADERAKPQLPQLLQILGGQLLTLTRLGVVPEPDEHRCDVPKVAERRERVDPGQPWVRLGCCPPAQHVAGADTKPGTGRPWCARTGFNGGARGGRAGLSQADLGWRAVAQGFKQFDQRLDGPVAVAEPITEEPVVDAGARVSAELFAVEALSQVVVLRSSCLVAGNVSAGPTPADLGDIHDQMLVKVLQSLTERGVEVPGAELRRPAPV